MHILRTLANHDSLVNACQGGVLYPDCSDLSYEKIKRSPRFLLSFQTQAYHNVSVTPPAETSLPGLAMLLGAAGIGMCGYSSRQLALYHRPSARVLQWAGTHTDASVAATAAQRTPFLDVNRRVGACQEIPPISFVGQRVPAR